MEPTQAKGGVVRHTVEGVVRFLHPFDQDKYATEDGWMMRREYGETPNGNPVAGRWVLRNQRGEWIDFDKYSSDLAERNDLRFAFHKPNPDGLRTRHFVEGTQHHLVGRPNSERK